MANFLLYGANGYTGELVAREAARRGKKPILAGRNRDAVTTLARELGLDFRIFSLDDPGAVNAGIDGMTAVLHCAGPFQHTYRAMADACLRKQVHYLDITGEVAVFEGLAARDTDAKAAGIMLMPGVGFDVVPSDCLAAHLHRRLPAATHLALAIDPVGQISHGTATTMVENIGRGGAVRRNGVLTPVPAAWKTRTIDFGHHRRLAFTIPWGDVATAYHTTGIPNIEVYVSTTAARLVFARSLRWFGRLLATAPLQRFLKARIRARLHGPTAEQRSHGKMYIWGEAADAEGCLAVARLTGPEGYTFTVLTALAVIDRVLAGDAPPGFQTPGKVFGPDFVLEIPGVFRVDEPLRRIDEPANQR